MGCRAAQRNGPITSASLAEQSVVAVSEPESANQEQNALLFAALLKAVEYHPLHNIAYSNATLSTGETIFESSDYRNHLPYMFFL